jgi:hypothetical protein
MVQSSPSLGNFPFTTAITGWEGMGQEVQYIIIVYYSLGFEYFHWFMY